MDGPAAHETKVAFIVPVRNDAVALERCLKSIARTAHGRPTRVIVVDNGSVDQSSATARRLGATVLELPGLPVGDLRNRGAAAAIDAEVFAFIDADHEIGRGWLDAAVETIARPGIGAVGCPYTSPETPTWVQRVYNAFRRHTPGVSTVDWLGAGNMAIQATAFARVGGFDVELEACEDVDLCQRLRQAGYGIVSDSRLHSVHHGDPRSLRALLLSELWRGRDNLRVSFREPPSLRNLQGALIPIVSLLCVIVALAGAGSGMPRPAAAAAIVFLLMAALRGWILFRRLEARTLVDIVRAFAVACVYDFARAVALITRVPHRRAHHEAGAAGR